MTTLYEVEIAAGIADIACDEMHERIGKQGIIHKQHRDSEIPFSYSGDPACLCELQTVIAVYAVQRFAIPRPKALLGHQHFHQLLDDIQRVMTIVGRDAYQTLYLSAAGSGSSVMTRIKQELSDALSLDVAEDEGDLMLRLRPTPGRRDHWDVLVRLTPRPLATRVWRVCNFAGALNASVANAMVRLAKPTPHDTFLNIACGSGTLLIERLAHMTAKQVIGCDINPDVIACARCNIQASRLSAIQLLHSDGIALPLPDNSVDVLCADLPFGQLIGSHEENMWLYPALLTEAARVARTAARLVVITHEVRLMEVILPMLHQWRVKRVQMITLSGLHPRIFVLERSKR